MKNLFKRTLAVFLAALMVLGAAPLAGFVGLELSGFRSPFAAKAEAATEPEIYENTDLVYGSGGTITRIEWLHNLTVIFEMTVSSDNLPDNYFFDLEDTSEYYKDAMLAVEFGVVDIPAGGNINPTGKATREFAAQTLNFCLGFQLENPTYTFSDIDAVTYDNDAQIALNRGWFALSNGKFNPEQNVTSAEINKMIADAQNVLAGAVIDYEKEDTYTFTDEVKVISKGTCVDISGNTVEISSTAVPLAVGDIFAVFPNDLPVIYIAKAVEKSDTGYIVETEHYEDDGAVESLDASGSVDIDMSQFIPGEGVTVIENDDELSTASTINVKKPIKLKKDIKLFDGAKATVNIEMSNISVDYDASSTTDNYYIILKGKTKIDFGAKFEALKLLGLKSISLGSVNVAGVGKVEVLIKFDISGQITYTCTGKIEAGFQCIGDDFRVISSFKKESFSTASEISASIWLEVSLKVEVIGLTGEISASIGVTSKYLKKVYDDEKKPVECETESAWLFAKVVVSATIGIKDPFTGKYVKGLSKTYKDNYTIFDENNSPARVYYHYEDGYMVTTCARTGKKVYTTSATSKYGSSGRRNARSQGYNAAGETYTVYEYSLDSSNNATITKYHGNARSIIIPETLDGYTVTKIGSSAFEGNTWLCTVIIPDSVVEIGNYAFDDCTNLSSLSLSKSLETLGNEAFGNCDSLTSIEIPKSLDVGGDMGYGVYGAFENCDNLKNVTFEEGTTQIAQFLFSNCTGLESIIIPDTVTTIEWNAFSNCTNLKSVTIPDSVVAIETSAFSGCTSLERVVIPSKVQSVGGYSFQNCTSLKSAEFKNSDTTLGTNMFDGCSKLETVKLPENIKKIEDYTFRGCKLLKSVNLPESITTIGKYAFYDCDALENLTVPSKAHTIGQYAFYDCDALTKVVIPDSVTSLGNYAFYGCEKLSEIDFGIGLKTIPDSAFRLLPALTEVYLPRFLTTIAANAFAENTKLKEVTIPATVTSIQDSSFSYPTRLTVYGLPGSYAQTHATNRRMTFVDVSDVKVDTIKFDKSSYEFLASSTGSKFVADMTIEPKASVEPITFTSSDTSIATVENGVITVKGYGTATITATTESGKTASCTVTINRKVTSVSLNKSKLSMKEGETATLTATVYPSNATNKKVIWISSNEKVAAVSNGTVTAVAPGTATITVKTEDGAYTANCEVTVTSSVVTLESITVKSKPSKTSYEIGESLNTSGLVLTAKYSDGSTKLVNTGYTTSGFNSSTAGTKTVTVSYGGKTTTFTVTVTANTQPDDPIVSTYTVTWVVDGKTTTKMYKEGDTIVKPATPSKSGYTFKGWTPEVPSTMPANNLTFTAVFEKNADPVVPSEPPKADVIKQPTETTIKYGDAIILHVDASKIPEGGRVEWSADNGNFKYSADGDTCRIDPNKSGTTTFTATIYDAQGNAVSKDEQTMTSKAGFFDKFVAFFKKLFGLTKVIQQSINF